MKLREGGIVGRVVGSAGLCGGTFGPSCLEWRRTQGSRKGRSPELGTGLPVGVTGSPVGRLGQREGMW